MRRPWERGGGCRAWPPTRWTFPLGLGLGLGGGGRGWSATAAELGQQGTLVSAALGGGAEHPSLVLPEQSTGWEELQGACVQVWWGLGAVGTGAGSA